MAKDKYTEFKIGEEDLPTASDDIRGQVRVKPHTVSEQGDRLMFCRMQDDGTTVAWSNLTGMSIQKGDTTVGFGMGVLDFSNDFTVTESPADEANIGIDYAALATTLAASLAGKLMVQIAKTQTSADTGSTASTTTYVVAITTTIALGPGTWQVVCEGDMLLVHSAGSADFHCRIDGVEGQTETLTLTTEKRVGNSAVRSGIAGSQTISCSLRYKSNVAGTTTARNPRISIRAVRTA